MRNCSSALNNHQTPSIDDIQMITTVEQKPVNSNTEQSSQQTTSFKQNKETHQITLTVPLQQNEMSASQRHTISGGWKRQIVCF
jgi:uncharacterized protein YjaZ